ALHARGETVLIGEARVRVLAPEDHLRLLCVHLLRHGAWRPLWLCDVAAAIETRAALFDWSRVLEGDQRRARWVGCAVGLAHKLLGARVEGTPFEAESRKLPRWLVPEVLKQWETPFPAQQAPMRYRAPMRKYVRRPRGLWRDLLNRWPNPIEATVRVGGPFNELPRWPFQLANCVKRAARFLGGTDRPVLKA
ncbi:MAG TPA: nucleotidyltransferase family protein, partial [Pyrinomonadaceae bacterium]|nr:nucleotidyltransferase family protein [Pyrinomonadaceae bacterium]